MDVGRGQEGGWLQLEVHLGQRPPVCVLVRTNLIRSPVIGFSMTSPAGT
jgi:hypothetical protein